ncbi:MAG: hypothetical protein M1821_004160 [Bathelium mastoideum]|nr:MAG: hypothetical protein M1821_004160 [Bathelium mastoideum]
MDNLAILSLLLAQHRLVSDPTLGVETFAIPSPLLARRRLASCPGLFLEIQEFLDVAILVMDSRSRGLATRAAFHFFRAVDDLKLSQALEDTENLCPLQGGLTIPADVRQAKRVS